MKEPILIIGAMEVELDYLIEKIEKKEEETIAGYSFYKGEINTYPVIIAKSQVGTINAAIVTTLAVQKYHPICIVNQGTAGSYSKNVHKKDLIIGTQCFNIMSAKTPYREENEGSDSTKWNYITFVADGVDEKIVQNANEKLCKFFKDVSRQYQYGNIIEGIIGSGDIWSREKDRIIYFNKEHGVLCSDMEAISIYTVANNYKIPVVSIKIISDNELIGESYERTVGKTCQEFVYEAINIMIKEILKK